MAVARVTFRGVLPCRIPSPNRGWWPGYWKNVLADVHVHGWRPRTTM